MPYWTAPYWTYENIPNNTPFLAAYVYGETFTFSMGFVNDTEDALPSVYLFVEEEYAGLLSVKLATESDYRLIMCSNDSSSYLGPLPIGETQVDFKFLNDRYRDVVYYIIPVFMSDDPLIQPPRPTWSMDYTPLWSPCYNKQILWRSDYNQQPLPCEPLLPPGGDFADDWEPDLFMDSLDSDFWSTTL